MKKYTLLLWVVFCLFACKQDNIDPYEKRDIIKELLWGDWVVNSVKVELEVANTPLALLVKDEAAKTMERAIMNKIQNNVLRITADKAYCYRGGQIHPSNYQIAAERLIFEDNNVLGFPISQIYIHQDSLIQNKMIAYMEKDEMIDILKDMGETGYLWVIDWYVRSARCNLFFKKDTEGQYDYLFTSSE